MGSLRLRDRLTQEIPAALKGGDKVRVGALRLLLASAKNREVELGHPLSDEEFIEVASREAKRRREAIEAYEGAGRKDRAAREREELQVLETYLPQKLTETEVESLIDEAISSTRATSTADIGKVMGYVMGKAKGRVEGKAVQAIVRERLTEPRP